MLNGSEKKVLDAITEYIAKNQFAPSYRELCELTGYASPSTIHSKIKALIQKGYVEAVKPRKCALRLKQPAADVVEVVRCRECVHYEQFATGIIEQVCALTDRFCDPNDYCSCGERKDGDG